MFTGLGTLGRLRQGVWGWVWCWLPGQVFQIAWLGHYFGKIRGHLNSSEAIQAYQSFCTISAPTFALFGKRALITKHLRKKLRHAVPRPSSDARRLGHPVYNGHKARVAPIGNRLVTEQHEAAASPRYSPPSVGASFISSADCLSTC